MSQIPPPPPGQPAPMGTNPGAAGSNKNLYTILAWALFPPIGSLIFLFVGKDDPDVKYNAAESLIIHGAFFIVAVILGLVLLPVYFLWAFIWFLAWALGVILAFQANGARVNYPVLGPLVAQYVPTVEAWVK